MRDGGSSAKWEEGDNHRLRVPAAASTVVVEVKWGGGIEVQVDEAAAGVPSTAHDAAKGKVQLDASTSDSSSNSLSLTSDDDMPQKLWQGRDIVFMRSNEHSRCAARAGQ